MTLAARGLMALVQAYRFVLRPILPPTCRFTPSCSEFAMQALARHGAIRGSWLTFRRITRCHPWGGFGYDPVPGDPIAKRVIGH